MLQDAVRDAQAAHIRILRRRDIEQPEIAPAEIVRGRRRSIVQRLPFQARIGVEGMLLALELLLVHELLARRRDLVLRLNMRRLRPRRLGIGLAGRSRATEIAADATDLETRHEAIEVTLLLVAEIAGVGWGFDFHNSTRRPLAYSAAA